MSRFWILSALALVLLGCATLPNSNATNYTSSTPHPALIATAQADTFARDAQATTEARHLANIGLTATYEADYRNVQGTAQAFAITKQAGDAQATATTSAQQTRDTLGFVMTTEAATVQAQQTETAVLVAIKATATEEAKEVVRETATAAAAATQTAFMATKQALELEQAAAVQQRQSVISFLLYFFLLLIGCLLIGLLLWFAFKAMPLLVTRLGVIRYGQHQNPLLLVEKNGRSIFTDPLRMLQAGVTIDQDGHLEMPQLTPDQLQAYITSAAMRLLHEQTLHPPQLPSQISQSWQVGSVKRERVEVRGSGGAGEKRGGGAGEKRGEGEGGVSGFGLELGAMAPLPAKVTWPELVINSPAAGRVTLGVGRDEFIHLDLSKTPHVLLSGSSGSGKTRRCLRPLIAQALAGGTFVAILNESGADFAPFYDHPNCTFIRGEVADYLTVLEATLGELGRREQILRRHRISEWQRLPMHLQDGPPILLVIDEVLALSMLMSHKEQLTFWSALAAYASRARKLSMGSVGALTDPTYRILKHGMNWREQCNARITFRVAKPTISRAVLDENGAEELAEGQFLAMLGRSELMQGTAAHPTDEELRTYLMAHRRVMVEPPRWLPLESSIRPQIRSQNQAVTREEPTEPVQNQFTAVVPSAEASPQPEPELVLPFDHMRPPTSAEAAYIQQLAEQGWSKNRICKTVYGFKNGRTHALVSQVLGSDE